MDSALAIIDVDIQGGQDERAREGLLENIRKHHDQGVAPLWVNLLRERADLRVVCLVRDLARLDDFLIDVIRCVPGVRGTAARLAFDGVVHGDIISELPLQGSGLTRRTAATIYIRSEPGKDRAVFAALARLPAHRQVQIVWVLKLFHSQPADIKLMLLGDNAPALTGYVMSWVRSVPGVMDTEMVTVLDWQILGRPEAFIEVSERFPEIAAPE